MRRGRRNALLSILLTVGRENDGASRRVLCYAAVRSEFGSAGGARLTRFQGLQRFARNEAFSIWTLCVPRPGLQVDSCELVSNKSAVMYP
jgi:hypothetical protein